jgi:solute carrier family 25 phosphate transporter 3
MIAAGRKIIATEGPRGLLTGGFSSLFRMVTWPIFAFVGFGPTAVGYLVQGGAKFAGYELDKPVRLSFEPPTDRQ